jgi:broad specificity phosphatase PhoE
MPSLGAGLTLYFCRHGETEGNVQRHMHGRSHDTALTALGRDQARAIAGILKHSEDSPSRLRRVASPLMRARTTMEIVLGELALPADSYTRDERLAEIDLGEWDGLTKTEARNRDPKTFDRRGADRWNIRIPGGESYADVAARAESWIDSLKADTFAVSHGGFTRVLRGLFLGLNGQQMADLDEPQGVLFRLRGSEIERLEAV